MGLLAFQNENLFNPAILTNFSFKDIHCCTPSSRGHFCSVLGISGPAQWVGGCLLFLFWFGLVFSYGVFPERNWEVARNWGTVAPWPLPASHSGLQWGQEWTQGHHLSSHCTEHTRALDQAGPQTIFIYGLFSEHTYDFITPLGDCALAAKTKYCPGKTLMWLTKLKHFSRFKSPE